MEFCSAEAYAVQCPPNNCALSIFEARRNLSDQYIAVEKQRVACGYIFDVFDDRQVKLAFLTDCLHRKKSDPPRFGKLLLLLRREGFSEQKPQSDVSPVYRGVNSCHQAVTSLSNRTISSSLALRSASILSSGRGGTKR